MDPWPAASPRPPSFLQTRPSFDGSERSFDQPVQANGSSPHGLTAIDAARDDDADENMSNDESMSSMSSFEMDDIDSFRLQEDAAQMQHMSSSAPTELEFFRRIQQQQQQEQRERDRRSNSLSGSFLLQNGGNNVDALQFAPASSSSNSTNGSDCHHRMWLHAHFAPGMAKAVRLSNDSMHDTDKDNSKACDQQHNHKPASSTAAADIQSHKIDWANAEAHREDSEGVLLVAVQNQVTSVQLRLLSNFDFLLSTDRANWLPPHGHTPRARVFADTSFIPPQLGVELFTIGYVEDENDVPTMEFLDRIGVSTGVARDHGVYIRLRVTSGVVDGSYEIPIRIFTQTAGFCDEEESWSSCIHVRVAANVRLPQPQDWRFHLDLWQHLSSIARAHAVLLWSDAHFKLIDRYFALLAELGQKCVTIVATELPWVGQQCHIELAYPSALYEHAILEVFEVSPTASTSAPSFEIDFQHFDRLLSLANKHHMDAEIEIFGLVSIWRDVAHGFDGPVEQRPRVAPPMRRRSSSSSMLAAQHRMPNEKFPGTMDGSDTRDDARSVPIDGWRIRCLHRPTQRVRYLRRMPEIERFIELVYAHCVALGIVDRVRVCADEPTDLPLFNAQMEFLQRLAPGFKVKVAMNNLEFFHSAMPAILDAVPILPLACADIEITHRLTQQLHEKGGKCCWYVCCAPAYPNQFVSSPLVEGELIGFLTFFLELDGFLRWNYCLWPAMPWTSLKWRTPSWKVGDMYFVLPGKDGQPVETLRLESLRMAIQTFELLCLAKEQLPVMQMEQLKTDIAQLIWRTTDFAAFCQPCEKQSPADLYSLDPLDYQRARTMIIDAIATNALVAGTSPSSSPKRKSFTHMH